MRRNLEKTLWCGAGDADSLEMPPAKDQSTRLFQGNGGIEMGLDGTFTVPDFDEEVAESRWVQIVMVAVACRKETMGLTFLPL